MTEERPPFLTRACVACKEKKLRCLMNAGPPWTCTRCLSKKLDCVIPASRPRQRKKKAAVVHEVRLEQLERSVDRVIQLLPGPKQSSLLSRGAAEPEAPSGSESISELSELSEETSPLAGLERILPAQRAHELVRVYVEQFAKNFPYVVLEADATYVSLRQSSPMLLLAILVTTSWKDGRQLEALNQRFVALLGAKFIENNDRDLDLLKGLLVYMNWIHLHTAKTQLGYRLTCMAVSLATDYGITRRPRKSRHQQLNLDSISEVPQGLTVVDADFWSLEARRVYLGCYHLAVWYSIIVRKVSPLAYSDYMRACAQSLAANHAQVASDADLIFQLELTHEADKAYTLFNPVDSAQASALTDEQVQIYLAAFATRIQDWRSRLPASLLGDASQKVWPWLFEAFVREVSFSGIVQSKDISILRIRVIMDSLEGAKKFFDTFLSIPPDQMIGLPATHWALLGYMILLAAAMSLTMYVPGWNIEMAQSIIKLDTYIDAVSVHVRQLAATVAPLATLKDWYRSLLVRWDAVKSSYLAALAQGPGWSVGGGSGSTGAPRRIDGVVLPITNVPAGSASGAPGEPGVAPVDTDFLMDEGLELMDFASYMGPWTVPNYNYAWPGTARF